MFSEIIHPKWGSNLASQVAAGVEELANGTGHEQFPVEVRTFFLGRRKAIMGRRYVGYVTRTEVNDDEPADRRFNHRCGLLGVVLVVGPEKSRFVIYLDGHVVSEVEPSQLEIRLDADEVAKYGGQPVAEVLFECRGKRWGPLEFTATHRVVCVFANRAQMESYLSHPETHSQQSPADGSNQEDVV